MRKGLTISAALHLGVLFWAVAVFPSARDPETAETTPLPVDLVSPREFTKIKAGRREAEKEKPAGEKPHETEPERADADKAERKESETVRAAAPESAPQSPEPAPEPEKKAEAAPVPVPAPAPKPKKSVKAPPENKKAVAKRKPDPKTPPQQTAREDFNPDRIAALLNKVPDAAPKKQAARTAPEPEPEPARGSTEGEEATLSISEIDALRAKISQCWNPPVGGLGADAIRVKLRLRLNSDGMLARRPEVVNARGRGSSFFQAAADSAVRAVMMCQPYELPEEKYALWRDMILNFDPREMFGG